jgi:hypothetical protein
MRIKWFNEKSFHVSITPEVWNKGTLPQNRSIRLLRNSRGGVQCGGKIHIRNGVTTDTECCYGIENPLRTQKAEQTTEIEDEKKGIPLYG